MCVFLTEDVDSFLTTAEKQKLILHEMEAVRASDEEGHIPGYDKIKLWTGKSIRKDRGFDHGRGWWGISQSKGMGDQTVDYGVGDQTLEKGWLG